MTNITVNRNGDWDELSLSGGRMLYQIRRESAKRIIYASTGREPDGYVDVMYGHSKDEVLSDAIISKVQIGASLIENGRIENSSLGNFFVFQGDIKGLTFDRCQGIEVKQDVDTGPICGLVAMSSCSASWIHFTGCSNLYIELSDFDMDRLIIENCNNIMVSIQKSQKIGSLTIKNSFVKFLNIGSSSINSMFTDGIHSTEKVMIKGSKISNWSGCHKKIKMIELTNNHFYRCNPKIQYDSFCLDKNKYVECDGGMLELDEMMDSFAERARSAEDFVRLAKP